MAKEKNTAAVLAGILAGAAAGLVLGVLFAPEEGKETRKKLKAKANDLKDQALDEYDKVSEKVKSEYGNLSDKAKENLDKVKKVMPAMTGPTISEVLSKEETVAVQAVIDEDVVFELVNDLRNAGAKDILVVPIERII